MSPGETIPPPPNYTPPSSNVSLNEATRNFDIGELVVFLSDSKRNRQWSITKINEPFIHIETQDVEGLDTADTIKVVTGNDIQKLNDFIHTSPFADTVKPTAGLDENNQYGGSIDNAKPPTINFQPVFKIMNGGNDFSTDANLKQEEYQGGDANMNEYTVNNNTPKINDYIKPNDGGSSQLDLPPPTVTNTKFDKLVIKKVE